MQKEIKQYLGKIDEILAEIKVYDSYKRELDSRTRKIELQYQKKLFGYLRYQELMERILKGKTKKEWMEYYDSYIYSLIRKIESFNSQIFYTAFQDHSYQTLSISGRPTGATFSAGTSKAAEKRKEPKYKIEEIRHPTTPVIEAKVEEKREEATAASKATHEEVVYVRPEETPLTEEMPQMRELGTLPPEEVKAEVIEVKAGRSEKEMTVKLSQAQEVFAPQQSGMSAEVTMGPEPAEIITTYNEPSASKGRGLHEIKTPKFTLWQRIEYAFTPKKKETAIERILAKEGEVIEIKQKPVFKRIGVIDYFKNRMERYKAEKGVLIADKTLITPSILELASIEKEELRALKAAKIDVEELASEAKRIRRMMAKKKEIKVYKPSFIGTVSNVTVRKFTLYLIERFPDFFKNFYTQLRLANIKVLSNTYINIMFFLGMLSFFVALPLWMIYFFLSFAPLYMIIAKGIMMSIITTSLVFVIFIYYPSSKAKTRAANINANLPFAIDHMAAVAGSGVNPTAMFKLITDSDEYGEICKEVQKIVEFIEIFGYDLTTAVRTVSAATPSQRFKEYLDGITSTVETGGDLKGYLAQKSSEAILTYKIERKKYTETIATYSDIYTGILVAAPLFFVSALSLVSMLGGTVGGINVDTIVVFGTYVMIPVMNLGFLLFLEFNQPQV